MHIIQIFKSVERINKPDYNTESRQNVGNWENLLSKVGYAKDGALFLPKEFENDVTLRNAELVIIQDFICDSNSVSVIPKNSVSSYVNKQDVQGSFNNHSLVHFFKSDLKKIPCKFGLFEFRMSASNVMDVWLNYDKFIGVPFRENHKIAELSTDKPIRYKLNAKSDFTMTRRKQRIFSEYDFVIENLGKLKTINFVENGKIEVIKNNPTENCKVVDERKILF